MPTEGEVEGDLPPRSAKQQLIDYKAYGKDGVKHKSTPKPLVKHFTPKTPRSPVVDNLQASFKAIVTPLLTPSGTPPPPSFTPSSSPSPVPNVMASGTDYTEELADLEAQELMLLRQVELAEKKARVQALRSRLDGLALKPAVSTPLSSPVAPKLAANPPAAAEPVVSPTQGMDQLKQMHGLARLVDDRLRSYGAAGLSLAGPDGIEDLVEQARDQESPSGVPSLAGLGLDYLGKLGRRSGREAKGTDFVAKRLRWAHTGLEHSHSTFEKLDFPLLMVGELNIISSKSIPEEERVGRIELLKLIAHNSRVYQWEAVRSFYEAVLLDIERGHRVWGKKDSYRDLEPGVLYSHPLVNPGKKSTGGATSSAGKGDRTRFYCLGFQSGTCSLASGHEAPVGNRKVTVEHFCRACFNKSKTVAWHAEKEARCPCKA